MRKRRAARFGPPIALLLSWGSWCMAPEAQALEPRPKAEGALHPSGPTQAPPAPAAVFAEVTVLHATNEADGGSGVDPQIGPVAELRKPPFSSYNSYKLVSRSRLAVKKSDPVTAKLPNNRILQITLREVLPGKQTRFRIAASINQPGGEKFLPLLEVTVPADQTFFVAGQSFERGMLVVGITVKY